MEQTLSKLQLLLAKIAKIPSVYQLESCDRIIAGVEIFQDKLATARRLFAGHGESYLRRAQILRELVEQTRLLCENLDQVQGAGALNCKIASKQLFELQSVLEGVEGKIDVLAKTIELVDGPTQTPAAEDGCTTLRQQESSCAQEVAQMQEIQHPSHVNQPVISPPQPVQPEKPTKRSPVLSKQVVEEQSRMPVQPGSITRDEIIQELQNQLKEYKNIVKLFKDESVSDQKIIDELMSENEILKERISTFEQDNSTLENRVDEAEDALAEILDKIGKI